jgi:enoyl-CoA hydratase/carnithine racemase
MQTRKRIYTSLERVGSTAIVTMRRAERRNALSLELMRELTAALLELGDDRAVSAIVIAGEGPAFSAGHDLTELRGGDRAAYTEIFDACVALMDAIRDVPQPVIAEVAGIATAAGCQLVAASDLAIASTKATFATPGVRIGLFCSTPMVALTRAIERKRAMEMLLTGEPIDAQTALAWGLVNRVVAPDALRDATLALAGRISESSRVVIGIGKRAFYAQIEREQSEAYAYTKEIMTSNALADEAQEGIAAFLERRPPRWNA